MKPCKHVYIDIQTTLKNEKGINNQTSHLKGYDMHERMMITPSYLNLSSLVNIHTHTHTHAHTQDFSFYIPDTVFPYICILCVCIYMNDVCVGVSGVQTAGRGEIAILNSDFI